MRDRTIGPYRADNNCSIYIIFRVFKLCEKEIGMRLFVDPEGMRQRRELEFDAETYEVTPGVLAR